MIVEGREALGRWTLTLKDDTPRSLREQVTRLGHVHITPTRLDPDVHLLDPSHYPGEDQFPAEDSYPQTPLFQRMARYTGVLLQSAKGDDRTISGYGLAWWLGTDDLGPMLESRRVFSAADIGRVLYRLLPLAIRPGTTWPTPDPFSGTLQAWQTAREALDYVLSWMGAEWRINPDGTLDAGPPEELFAGPDVLAVREAGWDVDIEAVTAVSLALVDDAEGWASDAAVIGWGRDDSYAVGRASEEHPHRSIHGDVAVMTRLVSESQSEESNIVRRAGQVLDEARAPRMQTTLSVEDFHVDGDLRPGRWVGVYDPHAGIYDLDNPVMFRGQVVYPMRLRVMSVTWPVTAAMGVYYRASNGEVLDLTDHVETSDAAVTVGVGASPRPLVDRRLVREAHRRHLAGDRLYQEPL